MESPEQRTESKKKFKKVIDGLWAEWGIVVLKEYDAAFKYRLECTLEEHGWNSKEFPHSDDFREDWWAN